MKGGENSRIILKCHIFKFLNNAHEIEKVLKISKFLIFSKNMDEKIEKNELKIIKK